MDFATRAIHAAQACEPVTGAVTAPIFQTSTFEQEAPGEHRGFDYGRTNNPTRARLEAVLATLESGAHCAAFASGLAAENAILQAHLRPGDEILIGGDVYGGTYRLLHRVHVNHGVIITRVDFANPQAVAAAIRPNTRLVWLESPTNPRLEVVDIAAIAAVVRRTSALLVVDNTFATPVLQRPLELGAHLVIHSLTKYIAGHSDLVGGAVIAREADSFEPIKFLQNATGAVPAPFDCWLTLRGIKTLELRVNRHCENAAALARFAASHPAVRRVFYPGLEDSPSYEIARRQMSAFGGVLSIELEADRDATREFVSSRRLFTLAESLGGVRSLICQPALMTHASIPAQERAALGLSDKLVRLSPGIESARDLIEDLRAGLDQVEARTAKNQEQGGVLVLEAQV